MRMRKAKICKYAVKAKETRIDQITSTRELRPNGIGKDSNLHISQQNSNLKHLYDKDFTVSTHNRSIHVLTLDIYRGFIV
jgi:hypothetical protein